MLDHFVNLPFVNANKIVFYKGKTASGRKDTSFPCLGRGICEIINCTKMIDILRIYLKPEFDMLNWRSVRTCIQRKTRAPIVLRVGIFKNQLSSVYSNYYYKDDKMPNRWRLIVIC